MMQSVKTVLAGVCASTMMLAPVMASANEAAASALAVSNAASGNVQSKSKKAGAGKYTIYYVLAGIAAAGGLAIALSSDGKGKPASP